MATKGCSIEDFESKKQAYAAADAIIAVQRTPIFGLENLRPDKIVEGFPQLDTFWFVEFNGQLEFTWRPLVEILVALMENR